MSGCVHKQNKTIADRGGGRLLCSFVSRPHAAARSHCTASTTKSSKGPMRCLSSLLCRSSSFDRPLPRCAFQALDVTRRKTKSAKMQVGTEINARRDGRSCVPIIASKNRSNPCTWSRERARQRRQKQDQQTPWSFFSLGGFTLLL